jgi:hypothetical protein
MLIKFFGFATIFGLQLFYIDVAFIIVITNFYKMDRIRLILTCQLIYLQLKKVGKKASSVFVEFFSHHFRVFLLEYFPVHVVGPVITPNVHYCI